MGRLTLRLPDSLHDRLRNLADKEGTSLNQYIVYALARQSTLDYTLQEVPQKNVAEQRERFDALLERLGTASDEEIDRALAQREPAKPKDRVPPEVRERLRKHFDNDAD